MTEELSGCTEAVKPRVVVVVVVVIGHCFTTRSRYFGLDRESERKRGFWIFSVLSKCIEPVVFVFDSYGLFGLSIGPDCVVWHLSHYLFSGCHLTAIGVSSIT